MLLYEAPCVKLQDRTARGMDTQDDRKSASDSEVTDEVVLLSFFINPSRNFTLVLDILKLLFWNLRGFS